MATPEPWVETAPPSADAELNDWLMWLEARHGEHIELGLERVRAVAKELGISKPAPVVVTVAGTNGKGSSVAMLERIWIEAGYRVGTYTSPHLIRFNERMRIDGEPLPDHKICAAFSRLEDARGTISLTYFEFATIAALLIFEAAKLDIVILEVGLGGRLDAVNIIDPDVSLIAAIGLDHEDWLGQTREAIGAEKAGIMRTGKPAVCSDHVVPASIPACADECGANLSLLGADFSFSRNADSRTWQWWSGDNLIDSLPLPALSGGHQLRNAAGVLKVIELLQPRLPVELETLKLGLATVSLRGRFHIVNSPHDYIMDVAHNPQAAEIFRATLDELPTSGRTLAIVGMLSTKKHGDFLRPLIDAVDEWFFTDLPGDNGAPAADLADCLRKLSPRAKSGCFRNVESAHDAVTEIAGPDDRILVIGSNITVGEMLRIFAARSVGSA